MKKIRNFIGSGILLISALLYVLFILITAVLMFIGKTVRGDKTGDVVEEVSDYVDHMMSQL